MQLYVFGATAVRPLSPHADRVAAAGSFGLIMT